MIAIKLLIVAFIGYMHTYFGSSMLNRPLIMGTLAGLVLDDIKLGITLGSYLEFIFLVAVPLGASNPPDMISGTLISVACVILYKLDIGVAVVIAVIISNVVAIIDNYLMMHPLSYASKKCDDYAKVGDYKKLEKIILFASIGDKFLLALSTVILFCLLSPFIKLLSQNCPLQLIEACNIIFKLLSLLEISLLASMTLSKENYKYLIIVFLLSLFFNISLPIILLLGACIIAILFVKNNHITKFTKTIINKEKILTNNEFKKMFMRSLTLDTAWNYYRQQNMNYCYMMIPVLKKLYKDDDNALARSLCRHLELMSCTPHLVTYLGGICAAMEEDNACDKDYDESNITQIKESLMGPIAGIGDSIFWGSLLVIGIGVGVYFGITGNILGPILFLLIINIPALCTRYFGLKAGYYYGTTIFEYLNENNIIISITKYLSALSVAVIGYMISMQNILNISSNFINSTLSLLIFVIMFVLLKKKIKNSYILIVIVSFALVASIF